MPHFFFDFVFCAGHVQGYKLGRQTHNLEGPFARYNCTYLQSVRRARAYTAILGEGAPSRQDGLPPEQTNGDDSDRGKISSAKNLDRHRGRQSQLVLG